MAEYAKLVIGVDSTRVSQADKALNDLGRTTSLVEKRADSLSRSLSGLAGPLAALVTGAGVKSLIDMSDNYGQMADRIRMVTESTEEYRKVQDRLLQSANSTYRPLAEAQELFIRTADTIRSLGYETEDALDITDSFSYLLVTNAASADRASSAISAYSKSIQTGKIDSESWQSLLAAMPSVVETLADELGRSSSEIRELGITGKLSLADLNEGLRRSVDASKAAADGMGTTLNDAIIRASNNWSAYLGESEKVTGASRLMSGALDAVSENLSTVADVASGVAVAAAARYSVALAQNTSAAVLNYRAKQAQAAEELKAAQAQAASTAATLAQARANVGLVGAIGSVTAATAAHEAAQKRLAAAQAATANVGRSLLGLMGGPVGLIATVGLTALSFVEFGDKAKGGMDKAANATEQAAMRIRNATRNMLPGDIGTLSFDALQEQASQVEAQLKTARDELERYQRNFDAGNISEQWLEKPRERVQALEGALAKLQGEMEGVRFASDTAGQSYSNNLERQAALVGKVTEEERLRAMVAAGYIKLGKEELEIALEHARRIDAVTASLKGSKSAVDQLESSYLSASQSLERQIALFGQSGEAARINYELTKGSLQGVVGKQATYLMGLANELDAKRDLSEQEKIRIDILRESGQLRAANDAQFELEYAAKIAEYERQGNVEALKRLETLRRIREIQMNADQAPGTVEGVSQAPRSSGLDAVVGGAGSELIRLQQEAIALEEWRVMELEKQRAFLEAKAINEEQHAARVANIHQQSADAVASIQGSQTLAVMSMAQGLTGDLMALMQQAGQENTALYKAMFVAQKAIAIGQAIISTELAAVAAMAPPPFGLGPVAGLPYSNMIRGLGYASVAIIGAQTAMGLSGMAHDGIDSIPREGTWLLDKGERVVDRRTNADLKEFLGSGGQGGGSGVVVNVNNAPPGTEVKSRRGSDGKQYVDVLIADLASDGRLSKALKNRYGLRDRAT